MSPGVVGGIAGGVAAGIVVVLWGLSSKAKTCPDCNAQLPRVRKPNNVREWLRGGWTCSNCGCQIDGKGKKLPE